MPISESKESRPFRFAIVGCGTIHDMHIRAIQALGEDAELVAVCDEVPERAKAAGEKNGVAYYTDLAEMLAQSEHPFDVLNVCTPSGLHAKHGIMGANAGKHVICEKPIDVTLEAADALIEACDRNNVKLVVISQHRYAPGMQALRRWQEEGKLGKFCYAEAVTKWYRTQAYYDSGGWRGTWELDGGGALMNQGVHFVDQIRWILGPPRSVAATMATRAHERIEVEDVISATIEFENGAVGTLMASTALYPGYQQALEVYGTGGTVMVENNQVKHAQFASGNESHGVWNMEIQPPLVQNYQWQEEAQENPAVEEEVSGGSGALNPAAIGWSGHIAQFRDLIDSVREDRQPFVNGPEARNALELIVGVYRAAKTGERVHFPLK